MKKFLLIGGGVLALAVIVFAVLRSDRRHVVAVDWQEVVRKHLVATVTASGTIHPRRSVDVSANVIGKVTELAVAEGDTVHEGDLLLRIDPAEYLAAVQALAAAVRSAEADLQLAEASAQQAEQDLRRLQDLNEQGLQSQQQLETARTSAQIERAKVAAATSRLSEMQANLQKARYDLDKVTVTAPMSGVVTRLNVEEGENAIMGTLNNPGTVLLVISDLSTMEARVRVDETEVVKVALAQPAKITIDAFPDTTYRGFVSEIGNSPIYANTGASQQAVDFEVKVVLSDIVPAIRPGLSAEADIETASRDSAVAVPLGAVVVRKWPPEPRTERRRGQGRPGEQEPSNEPSGDVPDTSRQAAGQQSATGPGPSEPEAAAPGATRQAAAPAGGAVAPPEPVSKDREGVFVVENGVARFRPVTLGIAGQEDFEVTAGLQVGQQVVTGPYRLLRDLEDGDLIRRRPQQGSSGRP